MKFPIIMSLLLLPVLLLAQQVMPIERGKLFSDMNGNGKSVTNLQSIKIGEHTIDASFLSMSSVRFSVLDERSNDWTTAFSWGNWAGPVTSNTAAIAVLQTNTLTLAAGVVITTNLQAQIVASTQMVVQAASTNGWETGAHKAWLTNETDAAALAFAATNRVKLVYNPTNANEWTDGAGGVWRVDAATNYTVTRSADFMNFPLGARPAWTSHAWPFSEAGWVGNLDSGITGPGLEGTWRYGIETYPLLLWPDMDAQGTAVVSQLLVTVTSRVDTVAWQSGLGSYATTQHVADVVSGLTLPPTNSIAGWLLYDPGSNVWLTVTVSNLSFTVWEVE